MKYSSPYWYNNTGDIKVFVVGAEHSGTRYLWGILKCHLDIGYVGLLSYPGNGRWWRLDELEHFSSSCKVVVIYRDKTCILSSQKKEGTCTPELLKDTPYDNVYDAAYSLIYSELKEYQRRETGERLPLKNVVNISYEGLVQQPEIFRNILFKNLGLESNRWIAPEDGIVEGGWFRVTVIPIDGNVKYINEEKYV